MPIAQPEQMTGPRVSVVIPTWNGRDFLPTTIATALGQVGPSLEVIVVDDGSTDGTRELLLDLDEPRLRVHRNEASRGVAGARNTGIALARADWIAFLDHDDLWSPDKLSAQLEAANQSCAEFVYSSAVLVDASCRVTRYVPAPHPDRLKAGLAQRNMLPAGQSNVVVRTELIRELGGFDERLVTLADWEMWIRLAWAGPGVACDEIHVAYRIHDGSMTTVDVDCTPDLQRMTARHPPPRLDLFEAASVVTRWRAHAFRRNGRRLRAAWTYFSAAVRLRSSGLALRGVGTLFGERAMTLARREARRMPPTEVKWLSEYQSIDGPRAERCPT